MIDFDFSKEKNCWRVKEVENLDELAAVLHLRFLIYSKLNLIDFNQIKSSILYRDFLSLLKLYGKDYFNGEYELDIHDRWYQFLPYFSGKKFSRLFMALKEDNGGKLNLEGRIYDVVGTERHVISDYKFANSIGLPIEPDYDMASERITNNVLSEVGRLVKKDGEDGSFIQALHRCIFQSSLDAKIPNLYCSSPITLKPFYEAIGFKVIGGPFKYKKLGGGNWLVLHMNFDVLQRQVNESINLPKIDEVKYFLNPLD